MSHTFTQLLYHIVFSTRNRAALIDPGLRDDLYPYMAGIIRNERGSLLAIGGMPDHLHLLVRLKPAVSLSGLLCSVKANSSGWVHENSIRQIRSAEGGRVCRPWRGSGAVGVLVPRADALGYGSAALRARGPGTPMNSRRRCVQGVTLQRRIPPF